MNSEPERSYRKNLATTALIYMKGEERQVSVINLSMTGMLVQLNFKDSCAIDTSTMPTPLLIDFYLPQLRLAGSAEVVRVDKEENLILLAIEFRDITYNIDNLLYTRKVYRKNMVIEGHILLNNAQHDFQTVNVSVEGLMIRLAGKIVIETGINTTFEFKDVHLKGEVLVIWTEIDSEGNTLAGLQYINMDTTKIKGLPRFYTE
jgi:hypothetical protein